MDLSPMNGLFISTNHVRDWQDSQPVHRSRRKEASAVFNPTIFFHPKPARQSGASGASGRFATRLATLARTDRGLECA